MNTFILLHTDRQRRCSPGVTVRQATEIERYKTVTVEINYNISTPYPSEWVALLWCQSDGSVVAYFKLCFTQLDESVPKSHTK